MLAAGSGSVQLVGLDTLCSFSAPIKRGAALIEGEGGGGASGGGPAARKAGLAQWEREVSGAYNASALTELLRRSAADGASGPLHVVGISGFYYACVAAKLIDASERQYKYVPALDVCRALERLRDGAESGIRDVTNASRLLTVLRLLFAENLPRVELLCARDFALGPHAKPFRSTWTAGWWLQRMVEARTQFKQRQLALDAQEAARQQLLEQMNALSGLGLTPGDVAKFKEGTECTFWFVEAKRIRAADAQRGQRRLQDLRATGETQGWLRQFRFSFEGVLRKEYRKRFLIVSHRWETKTTPDVESAQYEAIRAHLIANPEVEWVWYDYCTRTRREGLSQRPPPRRRRRVGALTARRRS